MERILLVEPNYKNKYPPIGLMKISTYFKGKRDFVQFHKGLLPQIEVQNFDKIFVTTLFTFDFDMCVETIRYYQRIIGADKVWVGGIAATIMPERFRDAVPGINLLTGQLTSSKTLGYDDDVNIDILELDYDILWDIAYEYPAADSYFIYTSRGCPRKCPFCAVKTLEPTFYECQNLREQIERVDARFGVRKQLLIMDNNALHAPHLLETVETLVELGFGSNNNKTLKRNEMPFFLKSFWKRYEEGRPYTYLLERIAKAFLEIKESKIRKSDADQIRKPLELIENDDKTGLQKYLKENEAYIVDFFGRYNHHTITRYVDFNQGLDARLFTEDKAQLLSRLAIKPCRIAFDNIALREEYFSAMDVAVKSGIAHFSNYLLYNYKDKPEDLWQRLLQNVEYCSQHPEIRSLFSFPMKYAAIDQTDRSYIGEFWNKKYLKSMNVILNVTAGIVAKEKDFFLRAFGKSQEEFVEILSMPDDFIRYRNYFTSNGLIEMWRQEYMALSDEKREELVDLLSKAEREEDVASYGHTKALNGILLFYTIKKKRIEGKEKQYLKDLNRIRCGRKEDAGAINDGTICIRQ